MALSQIEKLRFLATVKRVSTDRRDSLNQGIAQLKSILPSDEPALKTQVDTLFAATLTELAATITRINNAINALVITAADRAAYGLAAETEAKAVPN